MPRKKIKAKVGDVFAIPIQEKYYGFGQIVSDRKRYDKLYILFDYESENIPDIEEIINKPILAIAHLTDVSIEDGDWQVITNTDVVLKNIKYPNNLVHVGDYDNEEIPGLPKLVVENYDGEIIRDATEEDKKELRLFRSSTSDLFDAILFAKHNNDIETLNVFSNRFFDRDKWLLKEGEEVVERSTIKTNQQMNDKGYENEMEEKQIVISYKLENEGFGTEKDVMNKYELEDLFDEALQEKGIGDCDGSEIGNGEILIFCFVTDIEEGVKKIKKVLKKIGMLDKASIRY